LLEKLSRKIIFPWRCAMPIAKKLPDAPAPEEDIDFIKIVYKELSENARYYDSHVWQIPSITIAVNAFLIGQAFSENMKDAPWARALIVFSAAFFTFVLLIALVKHKLHKSAQDKNIKKIEERMQLDKEFHHVYDLKTELEKVEKHPNVIEHVLAPMRAGAWLMYVMVVILIVDAVILFGIFYS
jgi:hypothetical protein